MPEEDKWNEVYEKYGGTDTRKKFKRPLFIKLISIYIAIFIVLSIFRFIFIGVSIAELVDIVLIILCLYFCMWKMNKSWMYLTVAILILGIISIFDGLTFKWVFNYTNSTYSIISSIFTILLNSLSIFWLLRNRNLFTGTSKFIGAKKDWIKGGLIFFGMAMIIALFLIFFPDYSILGIPIIILWIIFIWFILPRIIKFT